MSEVRTENGDLVPEKWERWFIDKLPWGFDGRVLFACITELASWKARAEKAEARLDELEQANHISISSNEWRQLVPVMEAERAALAPPRTDAAYIDKLSMPSAAKENL